MRVIIFFILFFFSVNILFSDSIRTVPQAPGEELSNLFYIYFSNDGFGYDIGRDCDDYRSFGFNSGFFSTQNFFTLLGLYCMTNRSSTIETSSRIDELKFLAGYTFPGICLPPVYIRIAAGPGFLYHGNLGTMAVQDGFHNIFHFDEPRPLPSVYDPYQFNTLVFLSLEVQERFLNMFQLTAYAHLTHNIDLSVESALHYWILKDTMQLNYKASYVLNRTASFPPAAEAVYENENGVWLTSTFMAGPFYLERAVNLLTAIPAGSLGFRLNFKKPEIRNNPLRCDYALGGIFGFVSNIEILRIHPLEIFQRLSIYSWLEKHEDFDTYQKMFRMHIQSLGIELSLFNPSDKTYANPYAYVGGGFVYERETTNEQTRAEILDQDFLPIMHLGVGGRLKVSDFLPPGNFEYGFEVNWDLRFSYGKESIYSNAMSTTRYGFYISEQ